MANKGKYIDRNPNMRSAGIILEPTENIGDTLKNCSTEEAANSIMMKKCNKQIQEFKKGSSLSFSRFLPGENVKDLLCPELRKSRFIAFKEKFSEDMFFKKPELGQVFASNSKPDSFNNQNFTYGIKNKVSDKAYDLVLPRKTPQEVKKDVMKWHDKYIISHKDYLPGERIKRNYNDRFNPHATYGVFKNIDKHGKMVKKCLTITERYVAINKAQRQFKIRTDGELGERIDRYNLNLDSNLVFGTRTNNPACDVRTLLENVAPCPERTKQIKAVSYINKLRGMLFNHIDFHMHDLKTLLEKYDENKTGLIPFQSILKALRYLQINADEERLRLGSIHFGILKDTDQSTELADIDGFWKMLHLQYPLPRKPFMTQYPLGDEYKQTSYRLFCSDREKQLEPEKYGSHKAKYRDPTTAGDLIIPDVPMQYGLNRSDFEVLRPKEELKQIFKHLLAANFEQVWEYALMKKRGDTSCQMSVNEFRAILDEYNERNLFLL